MVCMVSMANAGDREDVPAFVALTAGGVSSGLTRLLCQPLDLIKIRFQLQVEPISRKSLDSKYKSFSQACQLIYKEEGLRGFWKGHIPAQAFSLTFGMCQFALFDFLLQQSKLHSTLAQHKFKVELTSGVISGSAAMCLTIPIDVVRTRLTAQGTPVMYSKMSQAFRLIWLCEGPKGYFRGLTPALLQVGPFTGLNLAMFNYFKRSFDNVEWLEKETQGQTISGNFLAAFLSGFISKLITYPMDLSRRRMQIQGFHTARVGFGKSFTCNSLTSCLRQTIREERVLGLFKGLFPSLLKASIVNALSLTIYEAMYSSLRKLH